MSKGNTKRDIICFINGSNICLVFQSLDIPMSFKSNVKINKLLIFLLVNHKNYLFTS